MTPKQIERIQKKIKDIRKALYDEKRMYGGYHDGRGLRYATLGRYIKINDYKGGLTYLRWFMKNFPDDIGMPDFLFEWTIILYKNGKTKEAESKAIHTYFEAPFLYDKFFERPLELSQNMEIKDFAFYSKNQKGLADFAEWLTGVEKSEIFQKAISNYKRLNKLLETEKDIEKRGYLRQEISKIKGYT